MPTENMLGTERTFKLPAQAFDRDLVFDFFWKFSEFECALKREGFLKAGPKKRAEPDWDHFGLEFQRQFGKISIPGFQEAVDKLKQLSPRRQVVCNGALGWESVVRQPSKSDAVYILDLLRISRNNLFHGGKYPDGPIEEVARDCDILRAALVILEGCYEIHPGVKSRRDEARKQLIAAD